MNLLFIYFFERDFVEVVSTFFKEIILVEIERNVYNTCLYLQRTFVKSILEYLRVKR